MRHLKACIDKLISEGTVANVVVRVGRGDEILCDVKRTAKDRVLTEETLFDMASVTKIVVTTSLALMAIDKGLLSPADPVSKFFPVPDDKKEMTVKHLMTHTMGIGHKSLLKHTGGYESVENYILNIPSDIPIGTGVRYSCPGFILLGRILETIYRERLDAAFKKRVAEPLGMKMSTFLPDRTLDIVNANPTEERRGIVNDYNCRYLGGVAGNAGLFSNLEDMTVYAKMLIARGEPLFSRETFLLAAQNHTVGMESGRGLGYVCVDGREGISSILFPAGSIGHTGHTGQSVFVDPASGFYVIVLSDTTRNVTRKYKSPTKEQRIAPRREMYAAIKADLGL